MSTVKIYKSSINYPDRELGLATVVKETKTTITVEYLFGEVDGKTHTYMKRSRRVRKANPYIWTSYKPHVVTRANFYDAVNSILKG